MMDKEFKKQISDEIKKVREVKDSTISVYLRGVNIVAELLGTDKTLKNKSDLDFLLKHSDVIKALHEGDRSKNSIKTYLAGIIVVMKALDFEQDDIEQYRSVMDGYTKDYEVSRVEQRKTDSQKVNWTTMGELRKVMNSYKKELEDDGIFSKEDTNISQNQLKKFQRWVLMNMYIGDTDNPPLRNDWSLVVISKKEYNEMSDEDLKKDNYLVIVSQKKKFISMSQYKTDKKYGTVTIPIGRNLNLVLNKWLKVNKTGWLLINTKGNRLPKPNITKELKQAFERSGKSIGSSILRSIFLSEKFPAVNNERQDTADKMLHSVDVQRGYSKVDSEKESESEKEKEK